MDQEQNIQTNYHKYELADKYQVSYNTFIAWLKRAKIYDTEGIKESRVLNPKQIKIIRDAIGDY